MGFSGGHITSGGGGGSSGTAEYDAGNSGTTKTIDWSLGNSQKLTLTGNVTLTFTNMVTAGPYFLRLVQDSSGGRTVTWDSATRWSGGTPPTITTTAYYSTTVQFYASAGVAVPGSTSPYSYIVQTGTYMNTVNYFNSGEDRKYAQRFDTTTGATIDSVTFYLKKVGSPVGTIWFELWSNSGSAPGSLLATTASTASSGTSSHAIASFPDPTNAVTLRFSSSQTLSASTSYWVVWHGDSTYYNGSAGNQIEPQADDSTGGYYKFYAYYSGAWNSTGTYTLAFKVNTDVAGSAVPRSLGLMSTNNFNEA